MSHLHIANGLKLVNFAPFMGYTLPPVTPMCQSFSDVTHVNSLSFQLTERTFVSCQTVHTASAPSPYSKTTLDELLFISRNMSKVG